MIVLLTTLIGCGSDRIPTYPVAGHVRFEDGEPVRTGTVELSSNEFGTTAVGSIQEDGSFVLGTYTGNDGAAEGDHRAIVVQIVVNDGTFQHTRDHGRRVPSHFSDYDTAALTVHVDAKPENHVTIVLPPP